MEYDIRKQGVTGTEKTKLRADLASSSKIAKDAIDMVRGIYGTGPNVYSGEWDRFGQVMSKFTDMKYLGLLTVTAIPELGSTIGKAGAFDLYKALNLSSFKPSQLLTSSEFREAYGRDKQMLRGMGLGISTLKAQMMKSYANGEMMRVPRTPSFLARAFGPVGNGVDYTHQRFFNAIGFNQFEDILTFINFSAARHAIFEDVINEQMGKISVNRLEKLRQLGISAADSKALYRQFTGDGAVEVVGKTLVPSASGGGNRGYVPIGGITESGGYWAEWNNWNFLSPEDAKAYEAFKSASIRYISSVILKGGMGDQPMLINHHPFAKHFLKFKHYFFSIHQRMLLPLAQGIDANKAAQFSLMALFGYFAWEIKKLLNNDQKEYTWKENSAHAFDNSGLRGLGDLYSPYAEVATSDKGYYQGLQSFSSLMMPPTFRAAYDLAYGIKAAAQAQFGDRELTESDIRVLQGLTVIDGMPPLRYFRKDFSGYVAEEFDLKRVKNK